MSRYTGPQWKKSRRLGFSTLETGRELSRRPYAPGQHGQKRKKLTEYGLQLAEKQKVRHMYGVNEKQFRNTFKRAGKMEGVTGYNFFCLLESRLDNVVYRLVKVGDVISVKERSRSLEVIKNALASQTHVPGFVEVDADKMEGKLLRLPERSELNQEINESLIVEYYNRLG